MIERRRWITEVRASLKRSCVTAVVGPRQAGKTTLARQIVSLDSPAYFDLEDPRSLATRDLRPARYAALAIASYDAVPSPLRWSV